MKTLRFALGLALLAVVWWWLLRHADLAGLSHRLGQLPAWAWGAAGAGLMGGHLLRAWRLRQEWRSQGDPGLATCLRLVLAHNAAVLLVPLRAGEGAYLWLVQRQWGVDWRAAGASLLRWRLQDLLVLAVWAVLLLLPWSLAGRLLLLAALLLAAANGMPLLWSRLAARAGLASVQTLKEARAPWRGLGASVGLWSLKIVANGGLIAALAGLPLWPPGLALRGGLGGELGGVQPLQPPAGLGAYEAGVWLGLHLPAGVTESLAPDVVAAALAAHAFSLCIALGAAGLALLLIPDPAARRQSGA